MAILPTEPNNQLPSRSILSRITRPKSEYPPESFIHLNASEHSLHLLSKSDQVEALELLSPTFSQQLQPPHLMGVKMVKLLPKNQKEDFTAEHIFFSENGTVDSHHPVDLLRDGNGLDAVLLAKDVIR